MSKSTTIVTTTTALSAIATEISSDTSGRTPSKQHLLSVFAKNIAGPKHDWGFLTGSEKPVIQKGIPEARLADLGALSASKAPASTKHQQLRFDPNHDGITLQAEPVDLFEPEMAAYLASKLTGDLICISEDFSTDPDHSGDVQLMMEPAAIHASADEPTIVPHTLWAGTPEFIERTAAAYFAASSSSVINELTHQVIEEWPEDHCGYDFKVFYLPHAVVVAIQYPFEQMEELEENEREIREAGERAMRGEEEEDDEDVAELYGFEGSFRIFIDKTLDHEGRAEAMAQVEDLLIRMSHFLQNKTPRFGNIRVIDATAPMEKA